MEQSTSSIHPLVLGGTQLLELYLLGLLLEFLGGPAKHEAVWYGGQLC